MASCIDASEIEGDELVDYLFFGDSSEFMGFSFEFCLFDLTINLTHFFNVVVNKIFFLFIFFIDSLFKNFVDDDTNIGDEFIKFLIFFGEVKASHCLS